MFFFLFFFRSSSRKLKAFQVFVGVNSRYFSGDVCFLKHFAINSPCLTIAIYIFFHFSRLFEKLGSPFINIFSAPASFKSVFRRFSVALYSLLFAL